MRQVLRKAGRLRRAGDAAGAKRLLEKTGVTGGADATATTAIASDKTVAASATTVNSAIAEDAQAETTPPG